MRTRHRCRETGLGRDSGLMRVWCEREGLGGAERWRSVYVVVVGGVDGMGWEEREKVTWEKGKCPWSNVS